MILYIDLEGTLVEGWHNWCYPPHKDKLYNWIKSHSATEVIMFSYAITNDVERKKFIKYFQNGLCIDYNINISKILTVEEIQQKIFKYENIAYETAFEFYQLNSKQWAFIKYCFLMEDEHVVLIDDLVQTMELNIPERHLRINLINPKDL